MLSAVRLPTTYRPPLHAEGYLADIEADATFMRLVLDEPAGRPPIRRIDLINTLVERLELTLPLLRAALYPEVRHD